MNKDFLKAIETSIAEVNEKRYKDLLNQNDLSLSEIGGICNLFCVKRFKDVDVIPFVTFFAEKHPEYFFPHLNRICYNNLDKVEGLIVNSLYLQFEERFSREITRHLKVAFYYSTNREKLLDRIYLIGFSNADIRSVIEEISTLYDIRYVIHPETNGLQKELDKYSWDFVLYSLCIFIEEFEDLGTIQPVIEEFINSKAKSDFRGEMEDYLNLIETLESNRNENHLYFAGKKISGNDLRESYKALRLIFLGVLKSHQVDLLITRYCLEDNLKILESKKDHFEFHIKDGRKETEYKEEDLKYQIESNFLDLCADEIINNSSYPKNDNEKYNHVFLRAWNKSFEMLLAYGLNLSSNDSETCVQINNYSIPFKFALNYILNQYVYSRRKYGDLIQETGGDSSFDRLFSVLSFAVKNADSSGLPFHLEAFDEMKHDFQGFLKEEIEGNKENQTHWKNVIGRFIFDGENPGEARFSLDEHSHIKLGEKCFGFRKYLARKEPTYMFYNRLLKQNANKQKNQNTEVVEDVLIEAFRQNSFLTMGKVEREEVKKEFNIEFDVLCYKSGVLFTLEVKSTHFRQCLKETHMHVNRDLMKAAYQLDKNIDFIKKNPRLIGEKLGVSEEEIRKATIKPYIVSTTFEYDHKFIGGYLKISHFELLRILNNERDKLILPFIQPGHKHLEVYLSETVQKVVDSMLNDNSQNELMILPEKWMIHKSNVIGSHQLFEILDNDLFWCFLKEVPFSISSISYLVDSKNIVAKKPNTSFDKAFLNQELLKPFIGVME